jgi:hypothetical protein
MYQCIPVYQCVPAYKYMLVLAYRHVYRLEYIYQCTRISPTVIGQIFFRNEHFEAKKCEESVFWSEMKYSKRKKGFPFVSLWSGNNLVEAERKICSEKKWKEAKKWTWIFEVNKRNTCETDPISLHFAHKRKIFFCETGAP